MKKLLYTIAITLSFVGLVFASETKTYTVSMTDVNRIVCSDVIKEVFFSEEKGLISQVSGTDAYIKFPVTITINQETQEKITSYYDKNAELFIVCGNQTHSLNLKPAKIAAQTIYLENSSLPIAETPEFEGKDEEEILAALMTAAIENDLPSGFKKMKKNVQRIENRKGTKLKIIYSAEYVGHGYFLREYHLFSPTELTILPVEVASFQEVVSPAAVLLTFEKFKGWSRAFVIERSRSER